jgi:hypothetical protein
MDKGNDGVAVSLPLTDARLLAMYFKKPIEGFGELADKLQSNFADLLAAAVKKEKNGVARVEFSLINDQDVASLVMMQVVGQIVAGGFMKWAGMFQSALEMIKMLEQPIVGVASPGITAGDLAAAVFWLENSPLPDFYGTKTAEALKEKLNTAITGKSAHDMVSPEFDLSSDLDIDCLKLMVWTTKEISGVFKNASLATMEAVKDGVAIGKIKNIKIFIG